MTLITDEQSVTDKQYQTICNKIAYLVKQHCNIMPRDKDTGLFIARLTESGTVFLHCGVTAQTTINGNKTDDNWLKPMIEFDSKSEIINFGFIGSRYRCYIDYKDITDLSFITKTMEEFGYDISGEHDIVDDCKALYTFTKDHLPHLSDTSLSKGVALITIEPGASTVDFPGESYFSMPYTRDNNPDWLLSQDQNHSIGKDSQRGFRTDDSSYRLTFSGVSLLTAGPQVRQVQCHFTVNGVDIKTCGTSSVWDKTKDISADSTQVEAIKRLSKFMKSVILKTEKPHFTADTDRHFTRVRFGEEVEAGTSTA